MFWQAALGSQSKEFVVHSSRSGRIQQKGNNVNLHANMGTAGGGGGVKNLLEPSFRAYKFLFFYVLQTKQNFMAFLL